MKTDLIKQNKD